MDWTKLETMLNVYGNEYAKKTSSSSYSKV